MTGIGPSTENVFPGTSSWDSPLIPFATPAKAAYKGLFVPLAVSRPLNHVFEVLSLNTNQMNISTYGFACASWSAFFASAACWVVVTPVGQFGFVCSAYSVIQ